MLIQLKCNYLQSNAPKVVNLMVLIGTVLRETLFTALLGGKLGWGVGVGWGGSFNRNYVIVLLNEEWGYKTPISQRSTVIAPPRKDAGNCWNVSYEVHTSTA